MTREEAIKIIDCYDIGFYDTAQDVREDMMSKYIKLDDAIGIITEHQGIRGDTFKALHNAYAVDIVRCGECKYYKNEWCYWRDVEIRANDFCSYGERSEE